MNFPKNLIRLKLNGALLTISALVVKLTIKLSLHTTLFVSNLRHITAASKDCLNKASCLAHGQLPAAYPDIPTSLSIALGLIKAMQ